MNAGYVEQNQIIDRYLLGKLSEEQADEFEVLCLHDQSVLDQLELSEKMLAGFHRADEQNLLQEIHPQSVKQNASQDESLQGTGRAASPRVFPAWNYATAASLFLGICLLSTITVFSQRDVPSSAYEPQINTSIFELTRTRSASAKPDYVVSISPEPEWMVLSMDMGLDEVLYDRYRTTLLDQSKAVVWQSDGLERNHMDFLTLSLNSAKLSEGNYMVRIEGLAGADSWVRVGEYAFRVQLKEQPEG
ncbi:MAG: hypothetical protein ACR2P1_27240 [Pseudomonadales bacterium]